VNQRRTQAYRFFGQDPRAFCVDCEGQVRFAFGLVHCGVGGGVDDQLRGQAPQWFAQGLGPGHVQLVAAKQVHLSEPAQLRLQGLGDLAMVATDEHSHGNRSASFKNTAAWSLADRVGCCTPQSMARSGSSQRIERSAAGL